MTLNRESLLQKAKKVIRNNRTDRYTDEELELVKAWLENEVTFSQVMKATNKSTGQMYTWLALGARQLWLSTTTSK